MKIFTNSDEINKLIRLQIIKQANLLPERVLNSLSTYGAELDKVLTEILTVSTSHTVGRHNVQSSEDESIYVPIQHSDVVVLFELQDRQSSNDMSETNDDNSVTYTKSYIVHLIIYGDSCGDVATTLVARLRTERCRTELLDEGISLERITDPDRINEFKNNTLWQRTDFDIYISVEYKYTQVDDMQDFEGLSQLNIIRE